MTFKDDSGKQHETPLDLPPRSQINLDEIARVSCYKAGINLYDMAKILRPDLNIISAYGVFNNTMNEERMTLKNHVRVAKITGDDSLIHALIEELGYEKVELVKKDKPKVEPKKTTTEKIYDKAQESSSVIVNAMYDLLRYTKIQCQQQHAEQIESREQFINSILKSD